ncbi:D-glycerate dehydrogenase [Bordetella sp. FB-8]|uniref:2-hydroxyacid dehydrogenase n=1 Tax=Bordetella sp. FB-8 TaxID=1159870 RepID=UPI00036E37A9|nr:D-glycerate dehydrogenase [Bordetella sp. FB-8]
MSRILVFRELPDDLLARLRAAHEVTVANPRKPEQRAAFMAALPTAQALIGSSFAITDALLDHARQLEIISSLSVGVDNYPLASLKARGIALCHTPGVLTETTADTIFTLMLATCRRVVELSSLVREGRWTGNIGQDLFGWDVHHKTVAILGFGRIGQAVARRAALGFAMQVLYTNTGPVQVPELQGKARHVPMDQALAGADIVVSTLPLTPQTRHLINDTTLAQMRPGAFLINGSRGGIVDADALLRALDSGHLRGAGLDVFEPEPLPLDSALRTHPRVTPLPHAGSATHETRRAMAEMAVDNLLALLAGATPPAAYPL